jgi:hypothetical protein
MEKKNRPFPANPAIVTRRYRGPDRREESGEESFEAEIRFDDRGNPVWSVQTTVPRRRKDDDTVDLLKCLDSDALALEDEEHEAGSDSSGHNPYKRG